MSHKIGFTAQIENKTTTVPEEAFTDGIFPHTKPTPRKSVVQVYFSTRCLTCAYYNDKFDLHIGDLVYVEGKLEGLQGKVVDITYSFKIKLSDYKKVTHLIDTKICGDLYFLGSHAISFQKGTIPFDKVISWFEKPTLEDDAYVSSTDDISFNLEKLSGMNIDNRTADKGIEYYENNRVCYIEIDHNKGRAIVSGSKYYTVEFEYYDGEIKNITCSCYCTETCKHEFAVMLQLKESLDFINESYNEFSQDYFAIIRSGVLFDYAIDNKARARLTLGF